MVREGLGWVEHSHMESPDNTVRRNPPIFGAALPMFHSACRARRPKAAQPGPRNAEKAVPGRFAPNCGEGTISVGRSLGLAHEFRGWRVQCGLASDPVTGRDRVEGGHRGWWGGLGCSLTLAFAR